MLLKVNSKNYDLNSVLASIGVSSYDLNSYLLAVQTAGYDLNAILGLVDRYTLSFNLNAELYLVGRTSIQEIMTDTTVDGKTPTTSYIENETPNIDIKGYV